jgi:hypothetical protein
MILKNFEYIISGIEDGIIAALDQAIGNISNGGYINTIATYSGELDREQIKHAIGALTAKFPLLLVSYAEGEDVLDPPTPAVKGKPRHYRHDCSFTVICCSDNARGEKARRRGAGTSAGVYRMISDVRTILGGLRLWAQEGEEKFLLNHEPFRYADVEYVAKLPELTAYAVHFETYFRFSEPDRSEQGPLVSELVFDVENTYQKGETNLPGVVLK